VTDPTRAPLTRAFHFFLATRLLGTLANQMLLLALAWQMYDLTERPLDLGLVGLFQFLPGFLLTIPAGQLVDAIDRRLVLAMSLALQWIVAVVLAAGSYGGWVSRELILGLGVLLGGARALQAPALQALVPTLVPSQQLSRAMAMSSAAMKFAVIAGPAIGGFLYASGVFIVYAVCSAFSAVSLLTTFLIPKTPSKPREPMTLASMFAGWHFIRTHPVVLGAISLDLVAVLLGGATALLPIYARDILATGPWGLGLLRAAPAVGALVVGFALSRVPLERQVGRRMFVAVAIYGVSTLVFAFSRDFLLSLAMLAIGGGADMVSVVVRQTLVQMRTPDELRGRVSGVNSTFISASNQLGEFRAGTMAEFIGAPGSVIVGALGTLATVGIWLRLFPDLGRLDRWK
jgi:MFS family permease